MIVTECGYKAEVYLGSKWLMSLWGKPNATSPNVLLYSIGLRYSNWMIKNEALMDGQWEGL